MVSHPLPPIYDSASKLLILGSFPSVKSRQEGFYYAHPQNRFWRVLAAVFTEPVPQTVEEKCALLHSHRLALWDVVATCEIQASADSTIRAVTPNAVSTLLDSAPICRIFCNGKTAAAYYRRYLAQNLQREAICLPSTSPANAAWSLLRLTEAWQILRTQSEGDCNHE